MSSRKTYIPGLVMVMRVAYKYATRWRDKIYPTLEAEERFAFDNAVGGIQSLLYQIVPTPPEPDA